MIGFYEVPTIALTGNDRDTILKRIGAVGLSSKVKCVHPVSQYVSI
jgi:hypothetical protein